MTTFVPDVELIQKYNQQGPRYTSYPTALKFSEDVDRLALSEEIEQSVAPISLYFHIPFCESLCWFCGCNTLITRNRSNADTFLDYLEKEMDILHPILDPSRRVCQLHFGGGTPNFLAPDQVSRVSTMLHDRFQFADDAEKQR